VLVSSPAARAGGDLDGDGYQDVVVGVPDEGIGAALAKVGGVTIHPGGPMGASYLATRILPADIGVPQEEGLLFGAAVAIGDFDGNGLDDLAIGAPGATVAPLPGAGLVAVLHQDASGLDLTAAQLWSQDTKGLKDRVEESAKGSGVSVEGFGRRLAAGDFDGDGFDDLAVQVREALKGFANAGAVQVLYGSAEGLRAKRNQLWSQQKGAVLGVPGPDDGFGEALATGDFDADGADDLAIGVPGEPTPGGSRGGVAVLFGRSKKGLTARGDLLFAPETAAEPLTVEPSPALRVELATGDFDGDGFDDLAVGNSEASVSGQLFAGRVFVARGAASGLLVGAGTLLHRDSSGVPGVAASGDRLGQSLAAGDLDGDGFDDLAAGVPGADASALILDSGIVDVFYGSAAGAGGGGAGFAQQDVGVVQDVDEALDRFGAAVATADLDANGTDDLLIGAPGNGVEGAPRAGLVFELLGAPGGTLGDLESDLYFQDGPGDHLANAEDGDYFGSVFAR